MKFYTLAAACLAFGLLASVVSADEKPQRAERRNSGAKPGGPSAKEPAEMASKMLSEFDSDGDSLLNARELTAMFTAMRERSLQAKAGQGRPGQSRAGQSRAGRVRPGQSKAGQSRPNPGQRGSGAKNAPNAQNQSSSGRAIPANVEGVSPASSKKLLREKADKRRKRPVSAQLDGSEQEQRPGGARPERPAAE